MVAQVSEPLFVPASAAGALQALEQLPAHTASAPLSRFAIDRSAAASRAYAHWRTFTPNLTNGATRLLADSVLDRAHHAGFQALRALALLGERETYTVAIENLRSHAPTQRANASEALENVREAALVRPLLGAWESGGPAGEAKIAPPWPE